MPAKMYYDKDVDKSVLEGKTIAIIGYGSQGRAQGLNMRDSGLNIVVGELAGTDNFAHAEEDGMNPMSAKEASAKADIIQVLVPDTVAPAVYKNEIAENMTTGKALVFSHGFNIHFGSVVPPKDVDVYMVAPKGPGHLCREVYEGGGGVPALIAIEQDATGNAKALALAHACGVGATRAGVLETTFAEETETDLFGEQVILCGGLAHLITASFETLVEAGYQPEIAYFECLHEVKLIADLVYYHGIGGMRFSVSDTAEYGDLTRGPRVVTDETKKELKKILTEIQEGEFAREWVSECMVGQPKFNALRKKWNRHQIEEVGAGLRAMMPWLGEKKL